MAEVQGKKIGVQGINSFSHLFILKALEKAGLNEGDVEFVDVPAQNVTRALEKGEIITGHTYEPYTSEALKKGYKILFTAGSIPGIINTVLAFRSDVVEQRPQEIQEIVKSLIEAEDYYTSNKAFRSMRVSPSITRIISPEAKTAPKLDAPDLEPFDPSVRLTNSIFPLL